MRLLIVLITFAYIAPGLSYLEQRRAIALNTCTTSDETVPLTKHDFRSLFQQNASQTGTCTGPDGKTGTCQPLVGCESLLIKLKQSPMDSDFITFLKTSNQICGKAYAVVCCSPTNVEPQKLPLLKLPETQARIKLPIAAGCGRRPGPVRNEPYAIVGGVTSNLGDWPWIALIGYRNQPSDLPFKCGGTLITNRHVLTAAHCIKNDLSFIRLGEYDLGTDNETTHVDVPVSKFFKHPKFSRIDGRNDIALLYLASPVQFTDKIAPICLPNTPQLVTRSFVNTSAHIAGWGRLAEGGNTATFLQHLQISVYENEMCREWYRKNNKLVSEIQFDETVICAGDVDGGKDSCEGDSGGPLMINDEDEDGDQYFLIGVVSYGIGCARTGTPGVYARVDKFIDWIQNGTADNA